MAWTAQWGKDKMCGQDGLEDLDGKNELHDLNGSDNGDTDLLIVLGLLLASTRQATKPFCKDALPRQATYTW